MSKKQLENLQKLLTIVNKDLVGKELADGFRKIITQILKLEVKAIEAIDVAKNELNNAIEAKSKATGVDIKAFRAEVDAFLDKGLKEQINGLNFIKDKAKKIRKGKEGSPGIPGRDGKDADEKKVKQLEKDIKTLASVIKENNGKLRLKELENEVKALKRMVRRKGPGGTSAIGVAQAMKRILLTEQPSGLINGSNKDYTVTQTIFAVMAFSLNGEVITQLPNYTISNKTITFGTALPAAYSGKDFEIKYIGK